MVTNFPYKSILVVCSVNTARSPIAEGYLSYFFNQLSLDIKINSCGIASNARDGMLISLDAKLVMKEEGINLPEDSKSIDLKKHPKLVENKDLILTLTQKHKEELYDLNGLLEKYDGDIFTLKEFAGEHGDIEDPSMKGIEGFRKARNEIREFILKGLRKWFPDDL